MKIKNLINISIPNSVTKIRYYSFADCNSIGNLHIPDSVVSIEGYAFYSCGLILSVDSERVRQLLINANVSQYRISLNWQMIQIPSSDGGYHTNETKAPDIYTISLGGKISVGADISVDSINSSNSDGSPWRLVIWR